MGLAVRLAQPVHRFPDAADVDLGDEVDVAARKW